MKRRTFLGTTLAALLPWKGEPKRQKLVWTRKLQDEAVAYIKRSYGYDLCGYTSLPFAGVVFSASQKLLHPHDPVNEKVQALAFWGHDWANQCRVAVVDINIQNGRIVGSSGTVKMVAGKLDLGALHTYTPSGS